MPYLHGKKSLVDFPISEEDEEFEHSRKREEDRKKLQVRKIE